ncbi:MAG: hypothetical protein V1660_04295 [archaeon]
MKQFEEFVENGTVKKQTPNTKRALSVFKEASRKKEYLELSIKSIPKEKMSPNFIADYCYDIIMEIVRAKMFIEGYNSGSSHEAEVSYMKLIGFQEQEVEFMDELRYYRNGTKYYGTILEMQYAEKTLTFLRKVYPRLKKLLD